MGLIWLLLLLVSCSSIQESEQAKIKLQNEHKELIHRSSKEHHYPMSELKVQSQSPYPWESGYVGG